ncbi:hypothetical protein PA598K_04016 [Paenibacillus sp. 598K]|uniref:acyl-CoA dehydrogenase family protein n=1 Tax=Paenibacillus sp. 598K TaxID=1117987 RepID=UPI000FFA4D24|nr:acyl-CoA dehydrogenase family protein [Paenibacillus sp. 598K]GBF75598.1 hypothetical protein PA598K_04016 [Paenibacillus sp. 598K]
MNIVTEKKESIAERLSELSNAIRESAAINEGHAFPHQNFDKVIELDLHKLTLPAAYGGYEYNFEKVSEVLIQLAQGCPSTALCLAMHYYTIAGLTSVLNAQQQEELFHEVSVNHQFFSSFNLPNVSIIQAGQDFSSSTGLKISKCRGGYIVNGKKRCVSGIERFKYLPIYGNQAGVEKSRFGITALMASVSDTGVSIESSWNMTAMKSTQSHDVIFDNVYITDRWLIGREGFGVEDTPHLIFWSRLAITSVYLGVAKAALDHVVGIMKQKRDRLSNKLIAFMPGPQFALADMRIKFEAARSQLLLYAQQASDQINAGLHNEELVQKSLMTKIFVCRTVNEIVWEAMQVEGMTSMAEGGLLERLYKDIRAATFHQPDEMLGKEMLAKRTLGLIAPKNRWA